MPGKHPSRKARRRKKILIVVDHPLLRRGLRSLIESEPDLAVCAEAGTWREAIAALAASRPDLVIADLTFKDANGLKLIKAIKSRRPRLPVLVLSMHDAPSYAERAFQAGARGFVTKQEMSETVLIAIRRVLAGEKYVSPKIEDKFGHK